VSNRKPELAAFSSESFIVTDRRTLQIVFLQCEYEPSSPRCGMRADAISGNNAHDDEEDTPDDDQQK
jgi:hypothetical protein